jgi:hypothetical protein
MSDDTEFSRECRSLRRAIQRSLRKQGYNLINGAIEIAGEHTKENLRKLNSVAIQHRLATAQLSLWRHEDRLIKYIANGEEISPQLVTPRLMRVTPNSEEELLFRYASLHWSIPVSSGYGRRLRFLIFDDSNGKLIGLFGLSDPVYSLSARDEWIGWTPNLKRERLYHVMDAYVLGAVPPYSSLLCGKLVALMALSNEVRAAFRRRYSHRETLIEKKIPPAQLVLLTTTSALGKSSVYNRIRNSGFDYWTGIGFTKGSGDFHFSNGMYGRIRDFVISNCQPTAKHSAWGTGYRNKREVIRKCLSSIGLSQGLVYHGIEREIFAAPLGRDAVKYLRGEVSRPVLYDWRAKDLAAMFLKRWLLPRAERIQDFKYFNREMYRLWPSRSRNT